MDDEIVQEFLVESHEALDQLDRHFVELERTPDDRETLSAIFRTVHTIKGTSGFLGFEKLQALTHAGENLLSRLRDGTLRLDPDMTNALLATVDAVRAMLGHVESERSEGDESYAELIERLKQLSAADAEERAEFAADEPAPAAELRTDADGAPDAEPDPEDVASVASAPTGAGATAAAVAGPPAAAPPAAPVPESSPAPRAAAAADDGGENGADGDGGPQPGAARSAVAESTIRVDVGLLDTLMNLVGELVLARNQILQHSASLSDATFLATTQRLNLITTELQEGVMKTRMQPIGHLWNKFPRVVRDLARLCGKRVRIEMDGKETELDRTILDAIKDPLTHIVRNSIDHGIESPNDRVAAGKTAEGVLRLRAFHEGGQVNIEISDDGRGIDPERIRNKAVEKRLLSLEQALRMNDRELVGLVFAPGFSTATQVTNVSGRGVGMDVVKTNIERIGGGIDVQSRPGEGTTLRIKIPLTLAIIPALVVTSGGERFAIPQVSLLELVRLEGEQAQQAIERIHAAPVYRLRGHLLPLVYLNRELQILEGAGEPPAREVVNIVVLQAGDRTFGLVVDEVNDTEEIVVKPLGQELKGLQVFAGATIMGDGRVALILDVLGLAQAAHVIAESRDAAAGDAAADADSAVDERRALLLFATAAGRRLAIPLDVVSRLEEFPPDAIEASGGRPAIQYRGKILPLVQVEELLDEEQPDLRAGRTLQVVVHAAAGRSVGLVVDRILDVVEERLRIEACADAPGLLGSAVIHERITDVLDLGLDPEAAPAVPGDREAA